MARLTPTPRRKAPSAIRGMDWEYTREFWKSGPFRYPKSLDGSVHHSPSFDWDAYSKHCKGGDRVMK